MLNILLYLSIGLIDFNSWNSFAFTIDDLTLLHQLEVDFKDFNSWNSFVFILPLIRVFLLLDNYVLMHTYLLYGHETRIYMLKA